MNWDDLRFFVALAECHTVTAAATRLGVNYVTVSRRIDRLEEALKQTLFDREKDGYHLTVEGLTLYRKMQPLQQNMDELVQGLDPAQRHKRCIKLSTVPSLAEHLVTPNLVRLQQQYPEIRLDVDASTRDVSVVRREADIALRLDLPESGECIARKLGELSYRLCGTPDWIERFHSGGEVATISYGGYLSNLPEARYIRQHFGSHSVRFQSNSVNVQKRAAESGYGLALLPNILLADSAMQKVLPVEPVVREIWMLVRKNSSQLATIRLVMDSLVSLFEENRGLL